MQKTRLGNTMKTAQIYPFHVSFPNKKALKNWLLFENLTKISHFFEIWIMLKHDNPENLIMEV